MSLITLYDFLLTCTLINYGIVSVWFLVFWRAHDGLYRLHCRWFNLSQAQFDAIHYLTIAIYKIGIMLLNLVPLLAIKGLM